MNLVKKLKRSSIASPIHKSELMMDCGYDSEYALRLAIRDLRLNGMPIANNGHAYFLAKNQKELQETIERHHHKAMKELETWKALKNIDFGQQGELYE